MLRWEGDVGWVNGEAWMHFCVVSLHASICAVCALLQHCICAVCALLVRCICAVHPCGVRAAGVVYSLLEQWAVVCGGNVKRLNGEKWRMVGCAGVVFGAWVVLRLVHGWWWVWG